MLNRYRHRSRFLGIAASTLLIVGLASAYVLVGAPWTDNGSAHGTVARDAFPEMAVLHRPATSADVLPAGVSAAVSAFPPVDLTTSRYAGRFVDGTEDVFIIPSRTAGHACVVDRSLADGTTGTSCGPVGNGRADAQPVIFLSRPAPDGGELVIMGIVPDRFTGVASRSGKQGIPDNAFAVRIAADESSFTLTGADGPHVVDVSAFHTPVLEHAPSQLPPDQRRDLVQRGQGATP